MDRGVWQDKVHGVAKEVNMTNNHSNMSVAAAAAAKSLQSCPTLCDPIDGSPPGSTVPGILQARTWSGLPFPSPMRERKSESEVAQSCPTLSDPMDCHLPGSSVHGIFQARVFEWVALPPLRWVLVTFYLTWSKHLIRRIFKWNESESEVSQSCSCPTLCKPMDWL